MSIRQTVNHRAASLLCWCLAIIAPVSTPADEKYDHFPGVEALEHSAKQLDHARALAAERDQLLMLVLGANWCHDSRDFVDKLGDPTIAASLSPRYYVLKLNLGYFDDLQGLMSLVDIPVLYGTPTVVVLDPITGGLLNGDSLAYWRSSEKRTADETIAYFERYPLESTRSSPATQSPELTRALAEIDTFEAAQGKRIARAFVALGDSMPTLDKDNPPQEFVGKWEGLAAVRGPLPDDLEALRKEARAQDAAGQSPIVLDYPSYPLFTID